MPPRSPRNPFLTSRDGIATPTPLFTNSGFAPALLRMAREIQTQAVSAGEVSLGQRGQLSSSARERLGSRAFDTGLRTATSIFQGQQQTFTPFAQALLELRAGEGAGQRPRKWWETALEIGIPIAGLAIAGLGGGLAGKQIVDSATQAGAGATG